MQGGRKPHNHHVDPHKGAPNVLVAHMEVRYPGQQDYACFTLLQERVPELC